MIFSIDQKKASRIGMPFFIWVFFLFVAGSVAQEMRAAWLVRYNWQSESRIDSILSVAARNKITDIFVQLRGRGDAYYANPEEPQAADYDAEKDILKSFITRAKYLNIRIHAWLNIFLVGSRRHFPLPENHILTRHPDWVLLDQNHTSLMEYASKDYRKLGLEGIYLNPLIPEVRKYHLRLIRDILSRYPFSGIHLDYLRLPSRNFYSGSVDDVGRAADSITAFVRELRRIANHNRINPIISIAVKANLREAKNEFAQDWKKWLENNFIDYAVVMNYTTKDNSFRAKLALIPESLRKRVVVGISVYDKGEEEIRKQVGIVKSMNYNKISIFSMKYFFQDQVTIPKF